MTLDFPLQEKLSAWLRGAQGQRWLKEYSEGRARRVDMGTSIRERAGSGRSRVKRLLSPRKTSSVLGEATTQGLPVAAAMLPGQVLAAMGAPPLPGASVGNALRRAAFIQNAQAYELARQNGDVEGMRRARAANEPIYLTQSIATLAQSSVALDHAEALQAQLRENLLRDTRLSRALVNKAIQEPPGSLRKEVASALAEESVQRVEKTLAEIHAIRQLAKAGVVGSTGLLLYRLLSSPAAPAAAPSSPVLVSSPMQVPVPVSFEV